MKNNLKSLLSEENIQVLVADDMTVIKGGGKGKGGSSKSRSSKSGRGHGHGHGWGSCCPKRRHC